METKRQILERLERSLQAARNAGQQCTTDWHMRGLNDGLDIAIRAVQHELKWLPAEEPKNDTDEG